VCPCVHPTKKTLDLQHFHKCPLSSNFQNNRIKRNIMGKLHLYIYIRISIYTLFYCSVLYISIGNKHKKTYRSVWSIFYMSDSEKQWTTSCKPQKLWMKTKQNKKFLRCPDAGAMFCSCLLVFGMWVDTEIPKAIICIICNVFFAINTAPRDNDFYIFLQSWTCMVEERLG